MRKMQLSTVGNLILVLITVQAAAMARAADGDAIRPYSANPYYWQYKGKPIMLIGASDKDNLWQWTGTQLTEHLDLMRSVGGNYVRNTMSDRNEGDLFAAKTLDDGRYDLDQWNDAYWERLRFFLDETTQARDHCSTDVVGLVRSFRSRCIRPFRRASLESRQQYQLGTRHDQDAGDFYGGSLRHKNQPVLDYQHRYIDKLMSIALRYDHVLYNINNESSLGAEWENYWAIYIKEAAQRAGKEIHVTSMQFAPGTSVRHVMTYPTSIRSPRCRRTTRMLWARWARNTGKTFSSGGK
jgi:hypothetical protein